MIKVIWEPGYERINREIIQHVNPADPADRLQLHNRIREVVRQMTQEAFDAGRDYQKSIREETDDA